MASECKATANVVARYGEAELPFLAFQSYYLGDFFKKTGVAVLLEKGAMFQNGFGARQHVTLICRYDLKTDIATVEIIPK
ncbi:hypothetical protein CH337_20165 [Rhodoblastus acidophilus]|nr:hypothetical protein CKO16_15875 [Rhodoblastus acidophilus]RAI16684.1 hypothetical protein CH337_20165 [Rhodoblastus acidophilus]